MEPVAGNIFPQRGEVTAEQRRAVFGHGPATVWFTGLSGSGKSTLAFAVERTLIERSAAAYVLDGDNVRQGLNADLGFSPAERTENIRRIGEVCALLYDAGMIALTAFISPYRADRDRVRALHPAGGFLEVHVDAPLETCERRDVKGLYARARAGEIPEFSGISAPYEAPRAPELHIDTSRTSLADGVDAVIAELERLGVIGEGPGHRAR